MEINEELQYSIKWHKTMPLLLATELQVPYNQTVMERTKLTIISGINPMMKEKTLLEADTQEEEVLQGEALQTGVLLTIMMTMTMNRMMMMTMKMTRDHYRGNLPSDPLADHPLEDNPRVFNL